jgi:hypothetical protein
VHFVTNKAISHPIIFSYRLLHFSEIAWWWGDLLNLKYLFFRRSNFKPRLLRWVCSSGIFFPPTFNWPYDYFAFVLPVSNRANR